MLRNILIIFIFALSFLPAEVHAFRADTFVTFANPVRGRENWQAGKQDPLALPKFQYAESTPSAYPVTWLLRYDAVRDSTMSAFFKTLSESDKNQTLGAFLEITSGLAREADVSYPEGTSFFNANRVFLSGYTIEKRISLIDTYMAAFFVEFGYYPKSVSARNLDSYSLEYLQSKYSVLTAMNHDDSFLANGNRVWGGYLGSPYFPDKNNSLIPSRSVDSRINLAMVRWAQNDLFNFYDNQSGPTYSLQMNDYLAQDQSTKYFEKLLGMYTQKNFNEFTYLNVGLENDNVLADYKSEIKKVYKSLLASQGKYNLRFTSLSDFGDWFKARYPVSSPAYYYETTDPLDLRQGEVQWYQSPWYRIGFKSENGVTKIIDFRVYNRDLYEDHLFTPNQSQSFYQEIPAVIDSVKIPGSEISLGIDLQKSTFVYSKQWDYWQVAFQEGDQVLTLEPDRIRFSGFEAPDINSKDIKTISRNGVTTWELTPYTPFNDTNKPTKLLALVLLLIVIYIIRRIKKNGKPKIPVYLIIGLGVSMIATITVFRNGQLYPFGMGFWGPNGHDAIFHLSLIEKFSASPFSFSHPQISGENISNYHFVFDFAAGVVVKLFGTSSLDLYFRYFPVIAGVIIVFLLNKLLKLWGYNKQEILLAVFLSFLAGSFGFIPKLLTGQDIFAGESAFWANQSISIFLNPPYALSIILLLLVFVLVAKREAFLTSSRGLLIVLLGALLAQTKVYAFILLLGALLFSKRYKLFFGVLTLGIIISLPFTALGGPSPFVFSPLWFPRSLFASFDRFYWPRIVEAWQAYEASGSFVKLAMVNLFALLVFVIGNLGMRLFGLIEIARSKSKNGSETLIRWVIFFGLIIPLLFTQNINPWNTIQFFYYSLFFLGIFTAKWLIRQNVVILLPLLLISVLTSIGTLNDYIGFYSSSRISYTELQALDKLRDQPRGIVLSPLFNNTGSSRIFAPKPLYSYISTSYISGLTGQPEFLADTINLDITGFNYQERARDIQRFYNTNDKQWGVDFLEKNNIKYVYETPLQKMKLAPSDLRLKSIFDSAEINIYQFN